MSKYKETDKFTLIYFGDANSTVYPTRIVTKRTIRKYKETEDKKIKGLAGIVKGAIYGDVTNLNFEEIVIDNSLTISKILSE